jgi:hypothetical protein
MLAASTIVYRSNPVALDYKKIKSGLPSRKPTDPRKIFTTLKRDTTKFKRPSDEQGDVFDAWYGKRTRTDNTLKMNTGSGKTVVGLLCLQSSLNEGVGPAVYVTPDKYLLHQVVAEAESLGIAVTEDEGDAAFLSGNATLVINIWKLVNGRSVFGVGRGVPRSRSAALLSTTPTPVSPPSPTNSRSGFPRRTLPMLRC